LRTWNVKNKSGASTNRGSWNHLKIIQKIPEQLTGQARNQGATDNKHTWHCAQPRGVLKQKYKTFIKENNIIRATNCKHRIAVTLCNLEIWFTWLIIVIIISSVIMLRTAYRLTFWRRNYFFFILAHPVYKMWIIREPNTLELWNNLHFEEGEKTESIYHV
jgi:hypothetical protein